jgi:O-antigen/teichoic acid export membrane protein
MLMLVAPLLSADPAVISGLQIAAPLIWIVPTTGIFSSIFRANHNMRIVALLNAGMLLAQVILLLIVLWQGGSTLDALAINTLTSAGQLIAALILYRRIHHRHTTERIALLTIMRHSLPFAAAGVLAALQTRINFLLLDQLAGSSAVGFYAASIRFVDAGRLFPQAYLEALYPRLTALANDPNNLRMVFRSAVRRLLLVGIAVTVLLVVWSGELLPGLFGETFRPAIAVLMLLALSLPLLIMKGVRTLYWYAHHQEGFTNFITLLALLVQIAVACYLIPSHGAAGAALAVLAAELTAVLCLWLRR